jgi:predicted  nucleic acid-binding Zn-ribbon protein
VHTLRRIWQRTCARIAKALKPQFRPSPSAPGFEREITAVTSENRTLAAALQGFRAELAQDKAEDKRKIAFLEAAHQEAMRARNGEAKQLADLQRRIVELETGSNQAVGVVKSLEASLTDASTRLDTMDNQVRLMQASNDEQAREFEASLSLAIARQATTDGELKALRDMSKQQVKALESSLADTSTSLEATKSQVRTLEKKLDLEHQLYLHTVQEIQSQVRNQDQRLNWTMIAAFFAMLLGTAAGGILIWDVQNNARILGGISKDVKQLRSSTVPPLTTRHPANAEEPAGLTDVARDGRHVDRTDYDAVGGTSLSGP